MGDSNSLESPVAKYEIRLAEVVTRTIRFAALRRASETFDRCPALNTASSGARIDNTRLEVVLSVSVSFKDHDNRPFDAEFGVAGTYTHKDGLPEWVVDYFTKVNGPIMLWPYMRELVASVTSRAGYAPLVIETMDVTNVTRAYSALQDRQEDTHERPR